MADEMLKALQRTEIEILSVVDHFCKQYNIVYSLYQGSALGAVRHQGFIPWDDDVDICMDRKDYECFIDLWHQHPQAGYYLQDTREKTKSSINHSKVMKEHTFYCTKKAYEAGEKQGIFVDVFPLDKVPDQKFRNLKTQFWAAVRMVYTRGYPFTSGGRLLSALSRCMLMLPSKLKARMLKRANRQVIRYQNLTDHYHYRDFSCPRMMHKCFTRDLLRSVSEVMFDGIPFSLTDEYESMLHTSYGNYMQMPPEEERVCKHMQEVLKLGE